MPSVHVLVPGDLNSRTGGYAYDRRLIDGLRERGWVVSVARLDETFPHPDRLARRRAAEILAAIHDRATVVIDGLAFGAMPDLAELERTRLRLVALVHHPLAAETGLARDQITRLFESERRALAAARLVVVTSRATCSSLAPYGVGMNRLVVVEPGTDPAPLSTGSPDRVPNLLCVASLVPRKGHDVLIDALATLRGSEWRLTCVGSLERDPDTVRRLRARIADTCLTGRVFFTGELDDIGVSACYRQADLLVLPTEHEGYGMAVAEALAHGVPVISTPTGAIPDLVGEDAGQLVPAGDRARLAAAVEHWLADPELRLRLAAGAREVRRRLPTWSRMADQMSDALEKVSCGG